MLAFVLAVLATLVPQAQLSALVKMGVATNVPVNCTGFFFGSFVEVCTFYCNPVTGGIIAIYPISGQNFCVLTMDRSIANLTELIALYPDGIMGQIPTEIGLLQSLQTIIIPGVSGTLPTELANIASLQHIEMTNGQLSGTIPSKLFANDTTCPTLDLSGNRLTGTIPPALLNCTRAVPTTVVTVPPPPPPPVLSLAYNDLFGLASTTNGLNTTGNPRLYCSSCTCNWPVNGLPSCTDVSYCTQNRTFTCLATLLHPPTPTPTPTPLITPTPVVRPTPKPTPTPTPKTTTVPPTTPTPTPRTTPTPVRSTSAPVTSPTPVITPTPIPTPTPAAGCPAQCSSCANNTCIIPAIVHTLNIPSGLSVYTNYVDVKPTDTFTLEIVINPDNTVSSGSVFSFGCVTINASKVIIVIRGEFNGVHSAVVDVIQSIVRCLDVQGIEIIFGFESRKRSVASSTTSLQDCSKMKAEPKADPSQGKYSVLVSTDTSSCAKPLSWSLIIPLTAVALFVPAAIVIGIAVYLSKKKKKLQMQVLDMQNSSTISTTLGASTALDTIAGENDGVAMSSMSSSKSSSSSGSGSGSVSDPSPRTTRPNTRVFSGPPPPPPPGGPPQ